MNQNDLMDAFTSQNFSIKARADRALRVGLLYINLPWVSARKDEPLSGWEMLEYALEEISMDIIRPLVMSTEDEGSSK